MDVQIEELTEKAKMIRKDIVEMVYLAKDGHPGAGAVHRGYSGGSILQGDASESAEPQLAAS